MKRGLALLFSLLIVIASVLPVGAVSPADDRIGTVGEALDSALGKDTPGAAIGIVEREKTPMLEGFGYADAEKEILVNPDTAFELGELSGIFVALAVYRLAEQGLLSPDATVDTYLPGSFMEQLDLAYPVTTRQLLLGTAGFEGRTFDLLFSKDSHRFDTLEKALLAEIPRQIAPPDSFHTASPFSIALAAYVVEHAADMPYSDYVQEQILLPLGMTHTLLLPTAKTHPETMAVGYEAMREGSFAAGKRGGVSYSGLYPATGVVSTAADLECLMRFLLKGNPAVLSDAARASLLTVGFRNGVFPCAAPALSVRGTALGVQGKTLCFGASFFVDPVAGCGAFVLTNVCDSALLALPLSLLHTENGVTVSAEGTPLELKPLCGVYVPTTGEGHSFVGKYHTLSQNAKAELNDGGELTFLGMTLRQIAPGVFADAGKEGDVAAVQFLTDEKGEVSTVMTADGQVYRPAAFWERELPAKILFYAMIGLSVFFLAVGAFSLVRYVLRRYDSDSPGFIYTLPLLFAGLMSACALLQAFLGLQWGGQAFSSVFRAMSVCTLVCSIGAIGGLLLAFVASLTRRKMPARVFRTSVLFVACLLLINYWGLTIL